MTINDLTLYGIWMSGAFVIALLIIGAIGAHQRETFKRDEFRRLIRILKGKP